VILAVDAFNLATDRRGMGRYVRGALSGLQALGEADVRFVVRDRREAQDLAVEFDCPVIEPRDLRGTRADAVWFPWNGMRFDPHAPSIVTIHDPFAFTYPDKNLVARIREQTPIRRALRKAGAIATNSRWTAAELQRLFQTPAQRITVVPHAIEPFWHSVAPENRAPYVLLVAAPEERKNMRLLCGAFDAAFAGEEVELIVVGELRPADERAFRAMRAKRRHVAAGDTELRELYSGALAVAVPSLAEGYGITAIEAMACGAPVVAANAGALPETCAGAALLAAPDDRDAWRDALRRIRNDGALRARLKAAGSERVAQQDPLAPARAMLGIAHGLVR
jgi:glycosyltransferase involved in cell wall biosynthesis